MAPVPPPNMEFRAHELRMTDAERIQVMEMVKQKKWTVSRLLALGLLAAVLSS